MAKKFGDWPIKRKLIAIQMLTTFIVILIYGIYHIVQDLNNYQQYMKNMTQSTAKLIGINSISALEFSDDEAANDILESLKGEPNIVNAWILDANGRLFATYSMQLYSDFVFPENMTIKELYKDQYYYYGQRIVDDSIYLGMVYLRLDITDYYDVFYNKVFLAILAMLLGLILAFAISNFSQKTISRPIKELVEALHKVSENRDFSIRVKKARDDDIGELYEGFNDMLHKLNLHYEEREVAEKALRINQKRLRQIIDLIPHAIFARNVEGRYLLVNDALAKLYNTSSEKLTGKFYKDVAWKFENVDEVLAEDMKVIESGLSLINPAEKFIDPQGQIRWHQVIKVPYVSAGSYEKAILVVALDITKRKLTELALQNAHNDLEKKVLERTLELKDAKEKAEESDQLKSAFLASMSHELRTPLNSIIGFTGIIVQELPGKLNDEQKKQLGMVLNSARHLLQLINDVLDISKIEAGRLEISKDYFNMNEIIQKNVVLFQPMVEKKNLQLILETDDMLGSVYSDQRRVEQIIINLVNNAVKFTEKGSITVRSYMNGDYSITSVTDTGIGIKKEDQKKLFGKFMQVDTGLARVKEGTGLGLAICKKLAATLGGRIEFKSQWDMGSTFTLIIPVKPEENTDEK